MRQRLRFGFRLVGGSNAGLSCGGWRLWVNGEDTYLTAKSLNGTWKVSLHGDDSWRLAVTTEHLRTANPVWTGADRAPWKFTPTPWEDGKRLAFVVAVARGALRREPKVNDQYYVNVRDRWDELTSVFVFMTEPGVSLDQSGVLAPPLVLESGRQVWLCANRERVPAAVPEPLPDSAMVRPLDPERDGVLAPGLMVVGVHVA